MRWRRSSLLLPFKTSLTAGPCRKNPRRTVSWSAYGAVNCSRGTDVFPAHLWNTASSIVSPTRVTYDKDTDDTYRQYSFAVYGIDGDKLYLRLRALKYNATPGATTVVKSGWTDLKGLEISFDE